MIRKLLALIILTLALTSSHFALANEAINALKKSDNDSYQRATLVRDFKFPEDHGPHNRFKTEWWYFTGNLEDAKSNPYGYQLTIFRSNIDPEFKANGFKANQVYMGHLGISDIRNKKFYSYELFQRSAKGLAGAEIQPLHIWINDWKIKSKGDTSFPLFLEASKGDAALSLELEPISKMVLQGNKGLSQKSSEPGNASYYYSYPRLKTQGLLKIASKEISVRGLSWMDREWSTSSLGENQTGWDWFSLQLSDSSNLMYYQLRTKEGDREVVDEYSLGSFVKGDLKSIIRPEDIELKVLDYWISKETGIKYPAKWLLKIEKEDLEIRIKPLMNNQEHAFNYSYWEGAVELDGTHKDQRVSGKGYVELTGY